MKLRCVHPPFLPGIVLALFLSVVAIASGAESGASSPAAAVPAASDPAGSDPLRVELSPGPYYVGATMTATLVVPGGTARPLLDLAPIRDFEAVLFDAAPLPEAAGETGYVFRLTLLPRKPGTLQLPALLIRGSGGPRTTAPRAIEVREPEPAADMSLVATLSAETCYVGQPLTLEIAWTFAGRISSIYAVDLRVPLLESADFKSRDFSVVPKAFGSPIGMPVGNTRVIGGAFGRTIRLRKIIVPQTAGTTTLPGAALLCSVVANAQDSRTGFAYAPQYDNQFFAEADKASAERLYVRSAPIKLVVLPLPTEGKPANFSGIVGEFSLAAAIDPTTVREGEPLTLTLRARGYAHPEVLDLPTFGQLPGFRGRFRIPADRAVPATESTERGAEKVFRQSIRPISSGVDKVPAIQIPFFDPTSATYQYARTTAMPIVVLPNSVVTAFDAVLSDGSRLKNLIVPKAPAIGPNFTAGELMRQGMGKVARSSAYGWAAFGLPPLLYAAFLAATRRARCRRFDPTRERVLWAHADFRRTMRGEIEPAALTRALHTYLSHRLNLGVVTAGAVEARLREHGVAAETLAMLRTFFQEGDRREFSADASRATIGVTNESAHAIARTIEAALGNSKTFNAGAALRVAVTFAVFCAATPGVLAAQSAVALGEAEAFFQSAITLRFEEPEAAVDAFRKAAAGYEYLLSAAPAEFDGGRLHYNAGAARFFAGDFGAAVYHFRMAEHASPQDARVRAALEHVRDHQPDATTSRRWRKSWDELSGWRKVFGGKFGGLALAGMWTLFWVLAAVAAYRPTRKLKQLSTVLLVGTAALSLLLLLDALRYRVRREGVVVAPEILARQGPAAIYEPAFESALHAGAEFRIVGQANTWLQIRLRGGAEPCWIPANSAAVLGSDLPIRPSSPQNE